MGELLVEKTIDVDAPAMKVWEALVDVESWTSWKPFMQKAKIGAGYDNLTNGASIKMMVKVPGPAAVPLSCKVNAFDRPNKLGWEGGVKGVFHADHSFTFEDKGGKLRITSRELFSGFLLPAVLLMVTKEDLEKLHVDWLDAIKKKVEEKDAD